MSDPRLYKTLADGRRVRRFDSPCPNHPNGNHTFGNCPDQANRAYGPGAYYMDEEDVHVGVHEVADQDAMDAQPVEPVVEQPEAAVQPAPVAVDSDDGMDELFPPDRRVRR